MTRRLYGDPPTTLPLGPRQTSSIPLTPSAVPPIQINRWCRNGMHPTAELASRIPEAANQAVLFNSKQVFTAPPYIGVGNGSFYVNKVLWNFAFHTGPYTVALFCRLVMNAPFNSSANSIGRVKIYSDAALTMLVSTQDFNYGAGPGPSANPFVFQTIRALDKYIENLSPDTDYYGTVEGVNTAFIQTACIWDCPSLTESLNGYLAQNYTTHTPILAVDRKNASDVCRATWKRGGSMLATWAITPGSAINSDSTDGYGSITTTSTTLTNILDRTSTTISSSTPGFWWDMRSRDRISQSSGVPCVLKVFGYQSGGADGNLVLKNSAGTTIATVSGFGATKSWKSVAFNAPAVLDKYDLQFKVTAPSGPRFHLYAFSAYELE